MVWLYRAGAVGLVLAFGFTSLTGFRVGVTPHEQIPPSVRSSPGGYRSFNFWHSGSSGGK